MDGAWWRMVSSDTGAGNTMTGLVWSKQTGLSQVGQRVIGSGQVPGKVVGLDRLGTG
jgi:hypothetical protein